MDDKLKVELLVERFPTWWERMMAVWFGERVVTKDDGAAGGIGIELVGYKYAGKVYIVGIQRIKAMNDDKAAPDPSPEWEWCHREPYLLDTQDKVQWANEVAGTALLRPWRVGDHCNYRPTKTICKSPSRVVPIRK
jgi:hypothetical protein